MDDDDDGDDGNSSASYEKTKIKNFFNLNILSVDLFYSD